MINLKNIFPLSDFVRNAKSHLGRLQRSNEPEILTVNGQAQAVILSTRAYQRLLNDLELAETLNTVHGSTLEALRSGQITADQLIQNLVPRPEYASVPADQAFAELDERINSRRKKKAS